MYQIVAFQAIYALQAALKENISSARILVDLGFSEIRQHAKILDKTTLGGRKVRRNRSSDILILGYSRPHFLLQHAEKVGIILVKFWYQNCKKRAVYLNQSVNMKA